MPQFKLYVMLFRYIYKYILPVRFSSSKLERVYKRISEHQLFTHILKLK